METKRTKRTKRTKCCGCLPEKQEGSWFCPNCNMENPPTYRVK